MARLTSLLRASRTPRPDEHVEATAEAAALAELQRDAEEYAASELQRSDALFLIGRVIFGGYFLFSAISHFMQMKAMAGYAKSKGVPAPELAVVGTGALLAAGGLSVITGIQPRVGAAAILTFLVGVSPKMHDFWNVEEPEKRQAEMINFTKNMALAGGAFLAAGQPRPWAYTLPV
jgi:putative oxidoreductase